MVAHGSWQVKEPYYELSTMNYERYFYIYMKFQIENFNADVKGLLHDEMSDEDFFNFCQQNPGLRMERDQNKQIFITAPTGFCTGSLKSDIFGKLYVWNKHSKSGKTFASSTGFTLPDGSVFSPDAAWVSDEKVSLLTEEEKNKFAPVALILSLN